jgi:predicted nucleic acid-binding protein
MKVVSNTSPLIAFSKIERLPILEKLFHTVLIPRVVYDEFLHNSTPTEKTIFFLCARSLLKL